MLQTWKASNSKNLSSERLFVLSLVDTKKPKRENVIVGLIDVLQTALHTKNCWKVGVFEFSCSERKLASAALIRKSKRLLRVLVSANISSQANKFYKSFARAKPMHERSRNITFAQASRADGTSIIPFPFWAMLDYNRLYPCGSGNVIESHW